MMPNPSKRVIDTKTKQIYKGLNLCYKALLRNGSLEEMRRAGKLAEIPEEDNFGYYKMRRFFPGRFIQEGEEEWQKKISDIKDK